MRKDRIQELIYELLRELGEDPEREGLKKTPERISRMYEELLSGYGQDPMEIVNNAIFESPIQEMVVLKGIEFYSLCEHHLLPFFGTVCVAYIPDGKIIGVSKLARIVDIYSRRLQVQERMTQEIADWIQKVLNPMGVGVVASAFHLCMAMRGARKGNARMVTTALTGVFQKDARTRNEFLMVVRSSHLETIG
jgi:GTP cyclohydrolase I